MGNDTEGILAAINCYSSLLDKNLRMSLKTYFIGGLVAVSAYPVGGQDLLRPSERAQVVSDYATILAPSPAFLPASNWEWARGYGGGLDDAARRLAVDAAGNTYLTGSVQGTSTFGPNTFTAVNSDAFVVKHSPSGSVEWAIQIGGAGFDDGTDVAIGSTGDVYVTGTFENTVTLGATTTLVSAGQRDVFVACYSSAGVFRWAQRIGGSSFENSPMVAVAGNRVVVTGSYVSAMLTVGGFSLAGGGFNQLFVASLDPTTGIAQWAIAQGATTSDELTSAIAAAPNGDVLVTGSFTRTTTLAGSTFTAAGGKDAYVVCVSAQGVPLWSQHSSGGTNDDEGADLAVDAQGDVYWLGNSASNGISLGTVNLPGFGLFIVRYSATGNQQWAISTFNTTARGIALARTGEVFVGGILLGSATFGSSTLTTPSGRILPFVAQYDSTGQAQWGQMPTNPGATSPNRFDSVYGVAVDLAGGVYLTGSFTSALTFGPSRITPQGLTDAFIAKLASPCGLAVPTVLADAACVGQTLRLSATNLPAGTTLQWSGPNGFTSTAATDSMVNATPAASGTYILTVTSPGLGCSVATGVTVNVEEVTTPTITQTGTGPITLTSSASSGNQWHLGGQPIGGATDPTYVVSSSTQNGMYTVVATSASGCVSAPAPAVNVSIMGAPADVAGLTLEVAPNPSANGRMVVTLSGYDGRGQLTVSDALGRLMHKQLLVAANGTTWQQTLDMEHWPAGLYLLRLQTAAGVFTRRLVRE